jgi:hypothetical protein
MKRLIIVGLLLAVSASPALADFVGDSLYGVLNFEGYGAANYFDPATGWVPAGSSGIQPNAIVADPDGSFVEFMFQDNYSGINVDVDAALLTVTQFPVGTDTGTNGWDINISGFDTDIANVTLISNTMVGFSWSQISGDALLFSHEYIVGAPAMGTAVFEITPVPVPGAVLLGMLGLSAVGIKLRKYV